MKSLFNTVAAVAVATTGATAVSAQDLTIAIVNNGHMINMQKVAEAYTAETGVNLNWVALEEGVLREQVTSDTATGGGQYDIINIGMQEAPIWGAAGLQARATFGPTDKIRALPGGTHAQSHRPYPQAPNRPCPCLRPLTEYQDHLSSGSSTFRRWPQLGA